MPVRIAVFILFVLASRFGYGQCFISTPIEVCQDDCGPVFWLLNDPPGTTYQWSIDCGTITNPTLPNPHTACFINPGLCEIDVIVTRPGEAPDTCVAFILVHPTTTEAFPAVVCYGDSVEINGTYYTPGIYMDTIFGGNIYGCDSFLNIVVAEIPPMYDTISFVSCSGSGDSIVVNETVYNEANPTGTEYITGTSGCIEMIVSVDLTFLPNTVYLITYDGCHNDGYNVVVDSIVYNESNPTGVDTLTGSNGCDSIVSISLFFYPVYADTISYFGCSGDTFHVTVDSILYNESNPNGIDTLLSVQGCDSIIVIDLVFMLPANDTITYEGCMGDGYSIMVGDSLFNESHPTGSVRIETMNCDSIFFVDLHFADCPDSLILNDHEICVSGSGSQYSWFSCYGISLPDTTQCIAVGDTGCVCVSFTDGSGFDTLCTIYNFCDVSCEIIVPDNVCAGDSVLITFGSSVSTITFIEWTFMLDSFSLPLSTMLDSFWLVYHSPGCYPIQLQLQDSGCVTFCTDTICVSDKPFGNICCDRIECDSCVNLMVSLIGTPPFSIAISDGTSIDTVNGIYSSVYNYQACPAYDTNITYTLLWIRDSIAACDGILVNSTASVYLEQRPVASITVDGNTLCANPGDYAYGWFDCQMTSNLSFDSCFVPAASGCYCVTVSTLLTDCTDSACVNFILSATHDPVSDTDIQIWYNGEEHSIEMHGKPVADSDIFLNDILGRPVPYLSKEITGNDMLRLKLAENTPSLLVVAVSSTKFSKTSIVSIPIHP
jgi:hypothetical protein